MNDAEDPLDRSSTASKSDLSQYRQRISPYRRTFLRVSYGSLLAGIILGLVPSLTAVDVDSWWWLTVRAVLLTLALVFASLWLFNVGSKHGKPDPG